jgi:hypothetical protein
MAIRMRELALLQAEVLNAASWTLMSWQISKRGWLLLSESALSAAGTYAQLTHTPQQTSPTRNGHSPPFLAYPALGHISFICIESLAPTSTARDTFVDALHRSGFPGKETRYTCARVKESDRIRSSDKPITSPYTSFHRAAFAGSDSHQAPYSLPRQTTPSCAHE